jgi:hypothetical protein
LSGRHRDGPTIDHAVSVADDPSRFWHVANWQLVHSKCNSSKGSRSVDLSPPLTMSEEERFGLTSEELAAWRARGLSPGASRQWFDKDAYLALPVPDPPPDWWPPS